MKSRTMIRVAARRSNPELELISVLGQIRSSLDSAFIDLFRSQMSSFLDILVRDFQQHLGTHHRQLHISNLSLSCGQVLIIAEDIARHMIAEMESASSAFAMQFRLDLIRIQNFASKELKSIRTRISCPDIIKSFDFVEFRQNLLSAKILRCVRQGLLLNLMQVLSFEKVLLMSDLLVEFLQGKLASDLVLHI